MIADFLLYGLLAGLMITITAGPLGSFVVWQRLAYFGDTLAHSALLGIALALWLAIDIRLAIMLSCSALAIVLVYLQRRPQLATDSLLGILSHGSLALGLVAVALSDSHRLDLNAFLFGDLLAVSPGDLGWIGITCLAVLLLLAKFWNALLTITVHAELAQVEGFAVERLRLLLMLMIALLVAVSMKVIGVLLITALLIIPAASGRRFADSPERMALLASIAGSLSILGGLGLSLWLDTPAGPSVVLAAVVLFIFSTALPQRQ